MAYYVLVFNLWKCAPKNTQDICPGVGCRIECKRRAGFSSHILRIRIPCIPEFFGGILGHLRADSQQFGYFVVRFTVFSPVKPLIGFQDLTFCFDFYLILFQDFPSSMLLSLLPPADHPCLVATYRFVIFKDEWPANAATFSILTPMSFRFLQNEWRSTWG